MDPERLRAWEPILQSQVAVALVLLAGLVALSGLLLAWLHTLWRENRELNRAFREHLIAQSEFKATVENVRQLIDLHRREQSEVDP